MKKLLIGAVVFSCMMSASQTVFAQAATKAGFPTIVSVDSIRVLRESKKGKDLEAQIQDEVREFETYVRKANTDVMAKQESLTKQASILSREALDEKQADLQRTKKELQRKIEDKREMLTAKIQKEQMKLRDEQLKVANQVLQEKGWSLMIEKTAPTVLAVATAIDKTDVVLKAVNAQYAKADSAKSTKAAKTAAATATA